MSESREKKSVMLSDALKDVLRRKEALCAALEGLAAAAPEDYEGEVARLSGEYGALVVPPEFAELLDKKFAEALKAARAGAEAAAAKQRRIAALDSEVEALLAADELATLPEIAKLEQSIAELAPDRGLAEKLAPLKAKLEAE